MRARYLSPLIVVVHNRGGAYILCKLDGAIMDRPVAAFRVVPYFACSDISLPDDFADITRERLHDMLNSDSQSDDNDNDDVNVSADDTRTVSDEAEDDRDDLSED